jgi:hypothetical protein
VRFEEGTPYFDDMKKQTALKKLFPLPFPASTNFAASLEILHTASNPYSFLVICLLVKGMSVMLFHILQIVMEILKLATTTITIKIYLY